MSAGSHALGDDVTVVIPTRDRGHRLPATIASVHAQTARPAMTIVVDDGSATPVAPALAGLPDVRVIRHDASRGVAAARNAGVLAAETEWVALLDDDDLWAPEKLERQLAAGRDADWVFGTALVVDGRGGLLETHDAPGVARLTAALREGNVIPAGSSNVLARRAALVAAGLFDETLRHYADWDLWLRLAASARPASIPQPVVGYVRHPASMQVTEIDSAQLELVALARKHVSAGQPELGSIWLDRWLAEGLDGAGHRLRATTLLLRSAMARRSTEQLRFTLEYIARAVRHRPLGPEARSPAPAWTDPARFGPPVG